MIGDLDSGWQRLQLRHLGALEAVARTGSFRAAAEVLGYGVSTLSDQVASLERLVGQPLVTRPGGRRAVTITPAGRRLLELAAPLAAQVAAARADLEALRHATPTLRLGLYQSVAVRLLPGVLRRLARTRPDLVVELVEHADDGELTARVARGEVDATFVALPVEPGPLATERLLDEPYELLVAADGPLAERHSIAPAELTGRGLVGFRDLRAVHHPHRRLPRGTRPRIVTRSDDGPTIHALVAAGVGEAILPRLSVDRADPAVRAVAIDPPLAPRTIALAWHRDRDPDGLAELRAAAHATVCDDSATAR